MMLPNTSLKFINLRALSVPLSLSIYLQYLCDVALISIYACVCVCVWVYVSEGSVGRVYMCGKSVYVWEECVYVSVTGSVRAERVC